MFLRALYVTRTTSEPNVDPTVRIAYTDLARIAPADDPAIVALTQHLTRWRVTRLQGGNADSLGSFVPPGASRDSDCRQFE